MLAREILPVVGLDESFMDKSPFDLSGGQMRRVAIAGVLVMKPSVLVLDEPTAGLDPKGQLEMMDLFNRLHEEEGITIILVTHQMEDVAKYADNMIVLDAGRIVDQGSPKHVFKNQKWLQSIQLDVPQTVEFANLLADKTGWTVEELPMSLTELADGIVRHLEVEKQVNADG